MDPQFKEYLSDTHISRVLADIWQKELTGKLRIARPAEEKFFVMDKGSLAVSSRSFPEKGFLRHILATGLADLITVNSVEEKADDRGVSAIRILIEDGTSTPEGLWKAMETFIREEMLQTFDWEEGEVEFLPGGEELGPFFIRGIDVPELILEGVRRMKDTELLERHIPPDEEQLRPLSPLFIYRLSLSPCEKYVLGLVDGRSTVPELMEASELGGEQTRRLLYVFLCLGLVGPASAREKTARLAESSPTDIDKVFGLFNSRCVFVFRYLTREIGPVAYSIMEKALEEIKDSLECSFSGMRLLPDGRIELKSSLRMNFSIMNEDGRRNVLRSMDELLMAEILAVKRTLGPHHEKNLIRGVEKIGENR